MTRAPKSLGPAAALIVWFLAVVGCGAGSVGEAIAPEAPSAAEALGDERQAPSFDCRDIGHARPLVVDWGSQDRLDLELTMRERIAVVHYGCDGLRLLPSCSLAGGYRFAGVSRKEDVVQLASADEIAANLPFSAVKLEAEVKRGQAIDLALVLVGKHVTTVKRGPRVLLEGDCAGATHFVHAAYVGAFAMDRGSEGEARALLDVFGRGAETSSSYRDRRATKDGDVAACRAASSRDDLPPEQCASTLRVELFPLVDGDADETPEAPEVSDACPGGMVERGGKCTRNTDEADGSCPRHDVRACRAQCDEGDAESCYRLARLYMNGRGVEKSLRQSLPFARRACEGGVMHACMAFQNASSFCEIQAKRDGEPAEGCFVDERGPILERACDEGGAEACGTLARLAFRDDATWKRFVKRACDLGEGSSCSAYAGAELEGKRGVTKDVPGALARLERACEGEDFMSCVTLFDVYEKGLYGVAADRERATRYDAQLCAQKNAIGACVKVAKRYRDAPPGISYDRDKAIRFFRHACSLKGNPMAGEACHALGDMFRFRMGGELTEAERKEAVEAYLEGCRISGHGCDFAITIARDRAFRYDKKACVEGDAEACERLQVTLADEGCGHGKERQCRQLGAFAPSRLKGRCVTSRKADSVPCQVWQAQGGTIPSFPEE